MKATNKLKGFTLSEMLVVLIITVIVVGLAFSILRLVQKQMQTTAENYALKSEVNRFRQALHLDMNSCGRMFADLNEQKLNLVTEIGQKVYYFRKEFVLRGKDTFALKTSLEKVYFDGIPISSPGEIDALELKLFTEKEVLLFFRKSNSAESYMFD